MRKDSAITRLVPAMLCLILTSCTCGREFTQSWSFPAKPTYGDALIKGETNSPVSFDTELRKILHVTNLEDAYIGCTNGTIASGAINVCSTQLNYIPTKPVVYTFVRELNPRSCRFMRALDAAQKTLPVESNLTATISIYDDQKKSLDCSGTCPTPCPYCTLAGRCTKPKPIYPSCTTCQ